MCKLTDEDVKLLRRLFSMKDLNEEDGYSKRQIVDAVNADKELDSNMLSQIRNYVMDKNLEYGFEDDEPNELGYATEKLGDRLYLMIEKTNTLLVSILPKRR